MVKSKKNELNRLLTGTPTSTPPESEDEDEDEVGGHYTAQAGFCENVLDISAVQQEDIIFNCSLSEQSKIKQETINTSSKDNLLVESTCQE